jgi:hypothetical protein
VAGQLSPAQLAMKRAHIRSEIMFSSELIKLRSGTAQQIAKKLQRDE